MIEELAKKLVEDDTDPLKEGETIEDRLTVARLGLANLWGLDFAAIYKPSL